MPSPWIAQRGNPVEFSRSIVERAHEELLAGNDEDPRLQQVRPLVRESWRRSLAHLVGSDEVPVLELPGDALDGYRRSHPLAGAIEMIRHLLLPGEASDSGVIVAVGDVAGRLLWVEGDTRMRGRAGDMGFVEGTNWSEDRVGTSAPGTALALGHSVQVRGSEHFNRLVQLWSCTAAPIRDLETGSLLGVIDVTGGDEAASPQAQLLVDATARAVENELLLARLRAGHERTERERAMGGSGEPAGRPGGVRESADGRAKARPRRGGTTIPGRESVRASLGVLGRDRALLELATGGAVELSQRHGEILLMLAVHRQGLTAERLAELVYGSPSAVGTLRPEMVRLRRALESAAPSLVPESRPYRCAGVLETDAQHVLSLLDRGAHRVALAAFRGEVLPDSTAPGVEDVRETVRTALREALLAEASADVLLAYTETAAGEDDTEALRQCLALLPARSPRRSGIVARLERLEA